MGDFPGPNSLAILGDPHRMVISAFSMNSLGPSIAGVPASTAWPSANLAIFTPFRITVPSTIVSIVVGGGVTATGNYDAGVYDEWGNRVVSSGATAKPSSSETVMDVTDSLIMPGLYYMAMSADGTQNIMGWTFTAAMLKLMGCYQAASAYVLPSTVTYATSTGNFLPAMAVNINATNQ